MAGPPFGPLPDGWEMFDLPDGRKSGICLQEALGAMANGTRVKKAESDPGDTHKDGALGTVAGSHKHPDLDVLVYFVYWDDIPPEWGPVYITGPRLREASF